VRTDQVLALSFLTAGLAGLLWLIALAVRR
jgi:hypothetical protein